jgi:pyruvate dehydrogenase E1 component beta subunit
MGWLGTVQRSVTDAPEEAYEVPLSKASIVRDGRDATVVGLGASVHMALDAAEELANDGIQIEVIDLRSVAPLDRATIVASAAKTGALLSVDDDYLSYGIGAEVIASVSESVKLRKRPRRISYPDIPVPFAPSMEHAVLPNKDKIVVAIKEMLAE